MGNGEIMLEIINAKVQFSMNALGTNTFAGQQNSMSCVVSADTNTALMFVFIVLHNITCNHVLHSLSCRHSFDLSCNLSSPTNAGEEKRISAWEAICYTANAKRNAINRTINTAGVALVQVPAGI